MSKLLKQNFLPAEFRRYFFLYFVYKDAGSGLDVLLYFRCFVFANIELKDTSISDCQHLTIWGMNSVL